MPNAIRDWALCLVFLVMSLPMAMASDDFEDFPEDDLTEEAAADPVEWRPVITHFYIQPRSREADPTPLHFELPQGVLPGLVSAWEDLEPRVKLRNREYFGQSFRDNEPIVCGWRVSKDGTAFEVHLAGAPPGSGSDEPPSDDQSVPPEKKPVQAVLAAQEVFIKFGIDVLMNVEDPDKKDEILRQFFSLQQFELSIHLIDDDPAKFRGAPEKDPITNGRTGIDRSERWVDIRDMLNDYTWARNLRAEGAYAFRVKALVSGRVDSWEEFGPPKEVTAEIRVSFVDQAIKIDKLEMNRISTSVKDKP